MYSIHIHTYRYARVRGDGMGCDEHPDGDKAQPWFPQRRATCTL